MVLATRAEVAPTLRLFEPRDMPRRNPLISGFHASLNMSVIMMEWCGRVLCLQRFNVFAKVDGTVLVRPGKVIFRRLYVGLFRIYTSSG